MSEYSLTTTPIDPSLFFLSVLPRKGQVPTSNLAPGITEAELRVVNVWGQRTRNPGQMQAEQH